MDFEFSDEQRQLGEAVTGFLDKEYAFERLRAIKRSGTGSDPKVWQGLADLGVLAINVPATLGGLGFGPLETLTLMNACGPVLLLEPVLSSAVTSSASASAAVKPGDSMPKRLMSPGTPCLRSLSMRKSAGGSP